MESSPINCASILQKSKQLISISHEYLAHLFGDDFLNSLPTIETLCGDTCYLDLVKPDELVDTDINPVYIAKGIACFERQFVTFGLQVKQITESNDVKDEYYIYTLFRRYTEPNSI